MKRRRKGEGLEVMLHYAPLGLIRATARSIDFDGMTVETHLVSLPRDSEVEITLRLSRPAGQRLPRLAASVATAGQARTTLTFHPYDQETHELLREVMRRH